MLTISIASTVAQAIVDHQKAIIGPLALEQAKKVPGIVVSSENVEVSTGTEDPTLLIEHLVKKYEELFGKTSIEVCKDAIRELTTPVAPKDLPPILQ